MGRLTVVRFFFTQEVYNDWEFQELDDMCSRCLYFLTCDDVPKDGKVFFPEIPPGEVISQNNKILVYQEFPSFGPLVSYAIFHT